MPATRSDIIHQLQKDILLWQGFTPPAATAVPVGLGPVEAAFPRGVFPAAAVHELLSETAEEAAVTSGFVAGLLSPLMRRGGACIWISATRRLFPPALKAFGVEPERVIFIDLNREKEVLWAMEEALQCEGLAAVVAEVKEISFTASRRLQLAVEQSRVTGLVLRHQPRDLNANACMARWRIRPVASEPEPGMPGVGFPRWQVELLKVRNGKPGSWLLEWSAGRFCPVLEKRVAQPQAPARKTG
ncbi:ImuA family protein [Chitinophaga japonensis]|uniref:Protein ImuA n=1 Tax=Chitinophaga japonensis TaxID=104662 RepID=A0A562SS73_CHIJA|nr:Error-prone repair protein ImuA [Chitinophaga japonensis]TWI84062.1 protein ImuA [Chitinophaga japonensis]